MIIVLALLVATIFIGAKYRKKDNIDSYLDKNQTTSIIGVFAIIIFFSHFFGYTNPVSLNKLDEIASFTTSALGQLMVVPFMFFSGYGVFEQFKKKEAGYAKSMPKNRIFKVYLMFLLSWSLFFILSFFLSPKYSVKDYLLSPLGIVSIGNSNWYVVIILVLYISTYLSILVGGNKRNSLIINIVLCITLVFIIRKFDVPSCWWDSIPSYAFGLIYSYNKDKIVTIYKKSNWYRWLFFLFSIALTVLFGVLNVTYPSDIFYIFMSLSFCLIFASLLCLFVLGNKFVLTLGRYCFWIYILQRISMNIFYEVPYVNNQPYLYFVICVIITAVLAFAMDKLFALVWSKINPKKVK